MNLEKERVEIYGSETEIVEEPAEVSVYNIYVFGDEYLDTTFHEAEYDFPEAGEELLEELESFREDSVVSWYGERVIPLVTDFRGHPSMSLHIPNSLIHDKVSEKNKAADFVEGVTDELESFLE